MTKTLIKAGTVVTMDKAVPDMKCGDVLIDGARIVEVAAEIRADGADVIDASDMIVMPGFVNAHIHTWQTAVRGVAADWIAATYLHNMHATLAPSFKPDDIYISNLIGALNQLSSGATTIVDWCHNNPTPEHTDAAAEGLAESGIRAVFMHGSPKPDAKPGQKHFSAIPHPCDEIERLQRGRFAARDGLLSLGMAILGPAYSIYDVSRADFALARELGILCSMHVGGGAMRTPDGFLRLLGEGLVGANINIVHGNNIPVDQLRALLDRGATVTVTPETELQTGFGDPLTGKLIELGSRPSIGSDIESGMGGDMFTNMRMALQHQRALDNQKILDQGKSPTEMSLTCRQALEWATIDGARMAGLDSRIGSLTPGKQGDVILLRKGDLNLFPVIDPVRSIVLHAGTVNVDTVLVGGRVVKRGGQLLYPELAAKKARLSATTERIVAQAGSVLH